jgi:hypothetical protein
MLFRFCSALVLVVLIAMGGIALEKRSLELRRSIARQQYRLEALDDLHVRLRLETQELGAPARIRSALPDAGQAAGAPPSVSHRDAERRE